MAKTIAAMIRARKSHSIGNSLRAVGIKGCKHTPWLGRASCALVALWLGASATWAGPHQASLDGALRALDRGLNRLAAAPNLVETAKGYIKHERETLEAVIQARNQAVAGLKAAAGKPGDAAAMAGLAGAENMLTGALGKLFALVEAYPDLKANQNMMQLSEELTSTENKVAFARQGFNDSVMTYNNACETFPSNLIANSFNFEQAQLLEIEDAEVKREVPKVEF